MIKYLERLQRRLEYYEKEQANYMRLIEWQKKIIADFQNSFFYAPNEYNFWTREQENEFSFYSNGYILYKVYYRYEGKDNEIIYFYLLSLSNQRVMVDFTKDLTLDKEATIIPILDKAEKKIQDELVFLNQ